MVGSNLSITSGRNTSGYGKSFRNDIFVLPKSASVLAKNYYSNSFSNPFSNSFTGEDIKEDRKICSPSNPCTIPIPAGALIAKRLTVDFFNTGQLFDINIYLLNDFRVSTPGNRDINNAIAATFDPNGDLITDVNNTVWWSIELDFLNQKLPDNLAGGFFQYRSDFKVKRIDNKNVPDGVNDGLQFEPFTNIVNNKIKLFAANSHTQQPITNDGINTIIMRLHFLNDPFDFNSGTRKRIVYDDNDPFEFDFNVKWL